MDYSHAAIEKKWQKFWEQHNSFYVDLDTSKPKKYILDMFPYPSGKGLHVGHPRGYTASDVLARMYRMQGYAVLHPIGWDAFGLPAEQYAMQTGKNPADFTNKNIAHFRQQLQRLGFSYDYTKEISTADPAYYKTTQLIFIWLYKHNLATKQNTNVNWCPQLGTVLANEEVVMVDNKPRSERGNYPVEKKPMLQWVLKICNYANELLAGLKQLQWTNSIKYLQKNWIGKKTGWNIAVNIKHQHDANFNFEISIFINSLGLMRYVSYLAISLESPLLNHLHEADSQFTIIKDFVDKYKNLPDLYRLNARQEKHGVVTNWYVLNPVTQSKIPVWIVNYLDSSANQTFAWGLPGFNKVDFMFARKYQLININNNFQDEHARLETIKKHTIADDTYILKNKFNAQEDVNFKLRDWVFSRQRYWGEPIPIIFWQNGTEATESIKNLPLLLPPLAAINHEKTGLAPLERFQSWKQVTNDQGLVGIRETSTMPQWAGSCWYYIGYLLKTHDNKFLDINSPKAQARIKKWLPVDIYIGGQEHAVLHLLYARFWHQFLFKQNKVSCSEPFMHLINQGMILGPDQQKMSKSRGNIISVDDVLISHGADAIRLNEMFMGPITATMSWSVDGLDACRHWLDRVYRLFHRHQIIDANNHNLDAAVYKLVRDVTTRIKELKFNTAISSLMVFVNQCYQQSQLYRGDGEVFLKLLSCFAPHLSHELWEFIGNKTDLTTEVWPQVKKAPLLKQYKLPVQINSRLKQVITIDQGTPIDVIKKTVLSLPIVKKALINKTLVKAVIIPGRIVNLVIT